MKKMLGVLAAAWLGLEVGNAAVLLEFVPLTSPIIVAPGGTFEFEVFLQAGPDDAVVGFDYYLLAAGANYQNGFSIFSRDSDLEYFSELNTPDAAVAHPPEDAVLGSTNARSLGAFVGDVFAPVTGPGTYRLASFIISVAPDATLGLFTISSAFASWLDEDFDEYDFASSTEIEVQVIPEPSTLLLLAAGLGWISTARRRRSWPKQGRR
jgi:hypothetical protein